MPKPTPSPQSPTPRIAGCRKILLIIAFIAACLRLVTFHLLNSTAHPAAAFPADSTKK